MEKLSKHRIYTLIFVIGFASSLHVQAQGYNYVINMPGQPFSNEVKEAVTDLSYWLEKAYGKKYVVLQDSNTRNAGIQLQWVSASNLSGSHKKQLLQDGQSFYLEIKNDQFAKVIGTGTNSFINGIYTFLYELGFRWYMPGDAWTIIPSLHAVKLNISRVYTPHFQNRSYFGTGGINAIAGLDPQNTFKQDFATWNRRNRLSSDYPTKGHTGQAFYNDNKTFLTSHPEYFCYNKVSRNGSIDIASKEAVGLYTNWALNQVKPAERFPLIGVDPADGSGSKDDCLPATMPQIKTWSDKYFWLANQVAQKAETKVPNAQVQLYAYASHAAPPTFTLHKNVYPVIIPYAFQQVAEPKEFIRLWQQKLDGRPMGIYDYWNITQWSNDVPQFNIYSIPEKLRFWKQNNVTTINLESTNAKGPMGHAFWLATQMMWNTNLSFDSLYNDFLQQCFGPASSDIKAMYDRWSYNDQQSMEWIFSLQDLNRAASKTKDRAILQRINELKAYVHYLKLYYDYQYQPTAAGYDQLIEYIYNIHHLRLLQTSALQARYIKAPKGYRSISDKKELVAINSAIENLTQAAIEKNFQRDVLESPNPYTLSPFTFDIQKASNVSTSKRYHPLYINGQNSYRFYLPKTRQMSLQVGATQPTKLIIKDAKEKIWLERTINGSKSDYDTLTVSLPAGNYTFAFGAYSRFSRFIFPDDVPLFSSNNFYDNYRYPVLYVYVPKGVTQIIYRDELGPGINKRGNWISPEGKTIQPAQLKYNTYRVEVPTNQSGKVWVLNIGHRGFKMLNIPNIFSLNPFQYTD